MGVEPVARSQFVGPRRRLIEHIRGAGVHDLHLLELFDRVPRHLFLPEGIWHRAYEDAPLPIGFGQTASQPSLQALTLTALAPTRTDRVLEVGTGSGFQTALLSLMADRVYSVERERELSNRARAALDALSVQNVALLVGDGTIGWRKYAPFEVIVVSAGAPEPPEALIEQLADGGRMLIPLGDRKDQRLIRVEKQDGEVSRTDLELPCRFVPLIGKFGWSAPPL